MKYYCILLFSILFILGGCKPDVIYITKPPASIPIASDSVEIQLQPPVVYTDTVSSRNDYLYSGVIEGRYDSTGARTPDIAVTFDPVRRKAWVKTEKAVNKAPAQEINPEVIADAIIKKMPKQECEKPSFLTYIGAGALGFLFGIGLAVLYFFIKK